MMRNAAGLLFLLTFASGGSGHDGRAELKLHALFSDGLVLQRDLPCPVWGTAAPEDEISVSISGQTKTAKTGADGRWSVKLDPLPAGGPHELKINQVTVRDVLVGEVWLAAGGANMLMPLRSALISQTEADDNPVPQIRFFVEPRRWSDKPAGDAQGAWRSNRSETVSDVSAAAYFFSRDLQRRLKVPVGILQAAADESYSFWWVASRAIQASPAMSRVTFYQRMSQDNFDFAHENWVGQMKTVEEARKRGEPFSKVPPEPVNRYGLSGFYNGMIAPLIPYALRGAIYYQDEIESGMTLEHRALFPGLIRNWRADWGLGDFPFGYVQLSGVGARTTEPVDGCFPKFRDVQARALEVSNTGMAVTVDIGEANTLRPRNKEEVGRRLALWAAAQAYGKDVVFSGPVFNSMKIEGNKIRVGFKNVGGGLKTAGDKLIGFTIASDFRRFVPARALIDGDSVVVWADDYQWPAAVRYAWEDNPECSLYNKEGLPASPFRTDRW
jgi:sialate O-acetylesterase